MSDGRIEAKDAREAEGWQGSKARVNQSGAVEKPADLSRWSAGALNTNQRAALDSLMCWGGLRRAHNTPEDRARKVSNPED